MTQELMNQPKPQRFIHFNGDAPDVLDDTTEDSEDFSAMLREFENTRFELLEDDSHTNSQNSDNIDDIEYDGVMQDELLQSDSADDPIGLYFRQMAEEPLLNSDEEIELARRIERGRKCQQRLNQPDIRLKSEKLVLQLRKLAQDGQVAREHLGRANTRLVVSIAKRYMNQGLPFTDLIQEGNVGLMRAVDKYDYRRGNRFSTYATWWIRQAITRALAQKTRTIRIPLHMTERIRQMYKTAQALEQSLGRKPKAQEIADEMDITVELVRNMMDTSQHAIALERPVGDDNDSEFGDFIEDKRTPGPVDATTYNLLQEAIEEVLTELSPRQSHILRLRFGLGGGEPHTLEQIATKFGLSRERIRQLEKEALRRLRHPKMAHTLRDYLG